MEQLRLPLSVYDLRPAEGSYRDRLIWLLSQNLDFHDQRGNYASHALHAFPAKFPPQLPRLFITALTRPGDSVLDPMVGSGTTIVESLLAERQGIGFDIDPLARLIATVKTTPLQTDLVIHHGKHVISQAKILFETRRSASVVLQRDIRWVGRRGAALPFRHHLSGAARLRRAAPERNVRGGRRPPPAPPPR